MHRVAFHYCVAVKKAADRLTTELSEAVGHQLGLGTQQQQQIRARILFFVQERTSLEAAGAVLTWVTEFFTIANPKEGEQILAQSLADAADSGLLLTSESLKILRYSTAKYGPRPPPRSGPLGGAKKGKDVGKQWSLNE